MNRFNMDNYNELIQSLEEDVFPLYYEILSERQIEIYENLEKIGLSGQTLQRAASLGLSQEAFRSAVQLCMILICGNEDNRYSDEEFIKEKLKENFKVIKGNKSSKSEK